MVTLDKIEKLGPLSTSNMVVVALGVTRALANADPAIISDPNNLRFDRIEISKEGNVSLLTEYSRGSSPLEAKMQCLAPEDTEIAHTSLTFTLGVFLYRLLGRACPFDGENLVQRKVQARLGKSIPLAKRNPDLPSCLCSLVDSLLDPIAFQRPPFKEIVSVLISLRLHSKEARHALGKRVQEAMTRSFANAPKTIPISATRDGGFRAYEMQTTAPYRRAHKTISAPKEISVKLRAAATRPLPAVIEPATSVAQKAPDLSRGTNPQGLAGRQEPKLALLTPGPVDVSTKLWRMTLGLLIAMTGLCFALTLALLLS